MQDFVDGLPAAPRYCSAGAAIYGKVVWPDASAHVISVGKEKTHTIESLNANLRAYLGRLKRRSRCFSRSLVAFFARGGAPVRLASQSPPADLQYPPALSPCSTSRLLATPT